MKRVGSQCLMAVLTALLAVCGVSAQSRAITYEMTGQFRSVGPVDDAGLDGAKFRVTVTIDPAAVPSVAQNDRGQVAVYPSVETVLHLTGSVNASLKGALRSSEERLEIAETYGGETCMTLGTTFEAEGTTFSVPPVCFRAGAIRAGQLPVSAFANQHRIGFRATHARGSTYVVSGGRVRVRGGEK